MPPDAAAADLLVSAFLDTIERRIRLLDVLRAGTIGLLTTAAAFVPVRLLGLASGPALLVAATFGLIAGGAIAWLRRARRHASAAAALVERALPESRNVVFTARELIATPAGTAVATTRARQISRRRCKRRRTTTPMFESATAPDRTPAN